MTVQSKVILKSNNTLNNLVKERFVELLARAGAAQPIMGPEQAVCISYVIVGGRKRGKGVDRGKRL